MIEVTRVNLCTCTSALRLLVCSSSTLLDLCRFLICDDAVASVVRHDICERTALLLGTNSVDEVKVLRLQHILFILWKIG